MECVAFSRELCSHAGPVAIRASHSPSGQIHLWVDRRAPCQRARHRRLIVNAAAGAGRAWQWDEQPTTARRVDDVNACRPGYDRTRSILDLLSLIAKSA